MRRRLLASTVVLILCGTLLGCWALFANELPRDCLIFRHLEFRDVTSTQMVEIGTVVAHSVSSSEASARWLLSDDLFEETGLNVEGDEVTLEIGVVRFSDMAHRPEPYVARVGLIPLDRADDVDCQPQDLEVRFFVTEDTPFALEVEPNMVVLTPNQPSVEIEVFNNTVVRAGVHAVLPEGVASDNATQPDRISRSLGALSSESVRLTATDFSTPLDATVSIETDILFGLRLLEDTASLSILVLNEEPMGSLSVDPTTITLSEAAPEQTVTLTNTTLAPVMFTANTTAPLTVTPSEGMVDDTLEVTVGANDFSAPIDAAVDFVTDDPALQATLEVSIIPPESDEENDGFTIPTIGTEQEYRFEASGIVPIGENAIVAGTATNLISATAPSMGFIADVDPETSTVRAPALVIGGGPKQDAPDFITINGLIATDTGYLVFGGRRPELTQEASLGFLLETDDRLNTVWQSTPDPGTGESVEFVDAVPEGEGFMALGRRIHGSAAHALTLTEVGPTGQLEAHSELNTDGFSAVPTTAFTRAGDGRYYIVTQDGFLVIAQPIPGDPDGRYETESFTRTSGASYRTITPLASGNYGLAGGPAPHLFLQEVDVTGAEVWKETFLEPDVSFFVGRLRENDAGNWVIAGHRHKLGKGATDGGIRAAYVAVFEISDPPTLIEEFRVGASDFNVFRDFTFDGIGSGTVIAAGFTGSPLLNQPASAYTNRIYITRETPQGPK